MPSLHKRPTHLFPHHLLSDKKAGVAERPKQIFLRSGFGFANERCRYPRPTYLSIYTICYPASTQETGPKKENRYKRDSSLQNNTPCRELDVFRQAFPSFISSERTQVI
jgi:hypothetical protein